MNSPTPLRVQVKRLRHAATNFFRRSVHDLRRQSSTSAASVSASCSNRLTHQRSHGIDCSGSDSNSRMEQVCQCAQRVVLFTHTSTAHSEPMQACRSNSHSTHRTNAPSQIRSRTQFIACNKNNPPQNAPVNASNATVSKMNKDHPHLGGPWVYSICALEIECVAIQRRRRAARPTRPKSAMAPGAGVTV